MVNIIKEEISLEESLETKLSFICEFAKDNQLLLMVGLEKNDKTNLTYIEPHRIIINDITFFCF